MESIYVCNSKPIEIDWSLSKITWECLIELNHISFKLYTVKELAHRLRTSEETTINCIKTLEEEDKISIELDREITTIKIK